MSNNPLTKVLFVAATVTYTLAIPTAAQGTGRYVQVEYPASAAPGELQVGVIYILWVPEGVTRLRGVIVHQHGAGRNAAMHGATAAYDLHSALGNGYSLGLVPPRPHGPPAIAGLGGHYASMATSLPTN